MKNKDILKDFVEFLCKEIIDNKSYYLSNGVDGMKQVNFKDLPSFHQEELQAKIKAKLTNNIIKFVKHNHSL